ncbi:MAG: hypothetical protein MUO63_22090 [Desulfobulbaceae bacterium]|nr:hypothetical protein [Desulfobulbaceae bacterium]
MSRIRIHLKPSKRAKKNYEDLSFDDFLIKGSIAKGKRVSIRPVRRIVELKEKKSEDEGQNPKILSLFDEGKK